MMQETNLRTSAKEGRVLHTLFFIEDSRPPRFVGMTCQDFNDVTGGEIELVAVQRLVRVEHTAIQDLIGVLGLPR